MSHVVPSGQTHTHTFPVLAASGNGPFTSYPPEHDDDDDEQLLYTYASFREEPINALSVNTRHNDTWSLGIEVPIPSIKNPTLLAINYMVKYGTTCDNGNSTIQTDTILTTEELPQGIVTDAKDLDIYKSGSGYAPRMIDHDAALCLSTTLAVKCNGGGDHWSHYVDSQRINPNVRIVDDCHLYVVFHVCEYPTMRTLRSLSVEVSATWQKQEVEIKARAEAERKAREEAAKKAKDEAERRAREAEERQAREEERRAREEEKQARVEERQARVEEKQVRAEEKQARVEEKQARVEEKQARVEEKQARVDEKQARVEERQPRVEEKQPRAEERQTREVAKENANAPAVADQNMQTQIAEAMRRLNLNTCESGAAWYDLIFLFSAGLYLYTR